MPPENQVNKDHLKDLFAGKKKAYKITEITHIIVPLLDELSVKNMLHMI